MCHLFHYCTPHTCTVLYVQQSHSSSQAKRCTQHGHSRECSNYSRACMERRARKVSDSKLYQQVFVASAFAHGPWFSQLLKQGAIFRRRHVRSRRHTTYRHSSSDTRGENLKRDVVSFSAPRRTTVDSSGIYATRFSSPCDFRYTHALMPCTYSVRQQHTRKTVTSSPTPLSNAQLAPPSSPQILLPLPCLPTR